MWLEESGDSDALQVLPPLCKYNFFFVPFAVFISVKAKLASALLPAFSYIPSQPRNHVF